MDPLLQVAVVLPLSTIPGFGEALDLEAMTNPTASPWDMTLASTSLVVSVFTFGLTPNYGGLRHVKRGFGPVQKGTRVGVDVIDVAADLRHTGDDFPGLSQFDVGPDVRRYGDAIPGVTQIDVGPQTITLRVQNTSGRASRASVVPSLREIPIMSAQDVKAALPKGYSKNPAWAYSIHEHHFYPKWLGGKKGGPTMPVRGYEHFTDLEPALFEHMKSAIPEIRQRNAAHIRRLIESGDVTRRQITDALFDFYRRRYPNLAEVAIEDALRRGL